MSVWSFVEIYFSPPPVSHRTRSMGQHPQYRIVFSWSAKSPRRERERENKSVDAVHSPAVFLFSYPFCLSIFVEIYCWPQPVSHRTRSTARHLGPIQFSLVKILGRSMKALFDPSNHLIFVSARLIFIFFYPTRSVAHLTRCTGRHLGTIQFPLRFFFKLVCQKNC